MSNPTRPHYHSHGIELFEHAHPRELTQLVQSHFPNIKSLKPHLDWHLCTDLLKKQDISPGVMFFAEVYYSYYRAVEPSKYLFFKMKVEMYAARGDDRVIARNADCWLQLGPSTTIQDPRPWWRRAASPLGTQATILDQD